MAKLLAPLLSHAAHGTIGGVLTYSNRNTCKQCRYQKKQADYESAARKTVRDAYRAGIELWNYLTGQEKAYWTEVEKKGYADV